MNRKANIILLIVIALLCAAYLFVARYDHALRNPVYPAAYEIYNNKGLSVAYHESASGGSPFIALETKFVRTTENGYGAHWPYAGELTELFDYLPPEARFYHKVTPKEITASLLFNTDLNIPAVAVRYSNWQRIMLLTGDEYDSFMKEIELTKFIVPSHRAMSGGFTVKTLAASKLGVFATAIGNEEKLRYIEIKIHQKNGSFIRRKQENVTGVPLNGGKAPAGKNSAMYQYHLALPVPADSADVISIEGIKCVRP